jgi:DNA gyrase subunit A
LSDDIISAAPAGGGSGGVAPISIETELRRSYLDYAMSVIVSRALPDARDGLKPVHRRILFSMHELGMTPDKPYSKCARVVGDVLGRLHPHGDQSVYDALVRMAQPFSMQIPLIDGQGNFGSVDGDSPAQMRYTECRMAKAATGHAGRHRPRHRRLQAELRREGAGAGRPAGPHPQPAGQRQRGHRGRLGHRIPPHNLGEVVDAAMLLLDDPEIGAEACSRSSRPRLPHGGEIIGKTRRAWRCWPGRGSIVVRGKTEVGAAAGARRSSSPSCPSR